MKIVVAMDSFKGCLSANQACQAITDGIKLVLPDCDVVQLPVSDGGDGLLNAIPCDIEEICVQGPLPDMTVKAKIGFTESRTTAIIESAQACGICLLDSSQLNPLKTNTYGVGMMMLYAAKLGCSNIIVGLGGSATNDLGTGMLNALGVNFYDETGQMLVPNGDNVGKIHYIDNIDQAVEALSGINITLACDVDSPLCGSRGAAHTFAPQKGATASMVQQLEESARSFSSVASKLTGRSCALLPGAGAAGGLGYAFMTFLDCKTKPGAQIVLNHIGFKEHVKDARLVITGEGHSDEQTLMGKTPFTVMKNADEMGVKTILISGAVSDCAKLIDAGFYRVVASTPESVNIEVAMEKHTATNFLKQKMRECITQIALLQ